MMDVDAGPDTQALISIDFSLIYSRHFNLNFRIFQIIFTTNPITHLEN